MYYKLTIKKIDRETGNESIILQGKYDSYNICEQARKRAVEHVNKMKYYTSSRIERR